MYDQYKKHLAQFVAFKSISTDNAHKADIIKCANWLSEFLQDSFIVNELQIDGLNPIVLATHKVHESRPTIVIYGHYDVQPASADWKDAFKLTEKDGKLFGRGVVDNKGQILIHICAIKELIRQKRLAYNVVFIIEGNEESGGDISLMSKDLAKLISPDCVLISDGEIPYQPLIEVSFRGGANLELHIQTNAIDLHSGLFGGIKPSAAKIAAALIKSLFDDDGKVTIQGFYDKDQRPTKQQIKDCVSLDAARNMTGSLILGFSSNLEVSGIKSGYCGPGFANIIPGCATIRFNVRTTGKNTVERITALLNEHITAHIPKHATWKLSVSGDYCPVMIDDNTQYHLLAATLLTKIYGKEPLRNYCGASIPIVSAFKTQFSVQPLLIPLGNDDCNMHGNDENFDIELIKKGLEFSTRFFS